VILLPFTRILRSRPKDRPAERHLLVDVNGFPSERNIMKRTTLAVIAACALLLPLAAMAADGAPTPGSSANQICKQEKVTLGVNFNSTYGTNADKSNAFGKCVAKNAKIAANTVVNAAKACDAEQTADAAAFATKVRQERARPQRLRQVRLGEGEGCCRCARRFRTVGREAVQGSREGRCRRLREQVRHR